MSTVADLLASKGSNVQTVGHDATVVEAIDQMNEHRIGALLVLGHDGRIEGIITERDVLRRVVQAQSELERTRIEDWMTREVVCCGPKTSIEDVQAMMKTHHIRHLPVADERKRSLGLISIQDVNAFLAHDRELEVEYLKDYLYGRQ